MAAAADKGLKVVLVDNNLDAFTKKTAVAATKAASRAARPRASTSSRC